MAQKISGAKTSPGRADLPVRPDVQPDVPTTKPDGGRLQRPLFDTRVIYCVVESYFKRSHKVIVAPTVQEILDEHIAKKLV